MDPESTFVARLEFLVPRETLHLAFTSVLFVLHAVTIYFVLSTVGEPYRLVIEELSNQAASNGTVLMLETLESTEENPLPGEMAPNPLAAISLMVSLGLHVLFILLQRWSVEVRKWLQFKRVSSVQSRPSHACVYPPGFRGRPEIVPLSRSSGEVSTYLMNFQRRKFEIDESGMRILTFPIERKISDLLTSCDGSILPAEVKRRQSLYGMNVVDIPVPPFMKLYMDQILSPIPIFQLFCSALWLMDEYWKYTLFTLFSIFGLEVSTTVQRKKSLETLRSMSVKSIVTVQVKRGGKWESLTSDQLVPGDRIKLNPAAASPTSSSTPTVVPCDCLIATGSAVANEASLTGESIPQMKDAIDPSRSHEIFDMNGRDRIHCLFSGTTLVRADPSVELIVLRTGSQSSQGELLRMVEFSQQNVAGDKKDTMYLLLLLLMFALAAAGYVVYERVSGKGSVNLTKMTSHKLMLRVIMIVTSVVPPELPMQLSLSVNTALMALTKLGIFCTEPFRVPMAGAVTHCFFDKTGTLTSDQLQCTGFYDVTHSPPKMRWIELVVAGCHSLIDVGGSGGLIGDPIELTALNKTGWVFDAKTNFAHSAGNRENGLTIKQRHHFSSSLQRMSCVVQTSDGKVFAVVKGSPEMILTRLEKNHSPNHETFSEAYVAKYAELAQSGLRVLALAYKELVSGSGPQWSRDVTESELKFAGFAAFGCQTRADSSIVVNALTDAAKLPCVMVTGDSALTSIHVAKQTGICHPGKGVLILTVGDDGELVWSSSQSGTVGNVIPFEASGENSPKNLSLQYSLVIAGETLPVDETSHIWTCAVVYVSVFARMSPRQKERIIARFKSLGFSPLMCGDGGNDVGALKQADVGVALLAGFGSANTSTTADVGETVGEDRLEEETKLIKLKEKLLGEKVKAEFAIVKKAIMAKQQDWMQEELAKPGNGGYWSSIKIVTARMREELAAEGKKLQAKYGVAQVWSGSALGGQAAGGIGDVATSASGQPTISMGDASVAAPFTSRAPSIRSVVEIIKQGRCTLLVAVQMMQIMMLESLVSAYTFAAITMEGGRSTEIQLIGSSVFVMIASIAFTYAQPSKRMSSVIPLRSVFHPAIFFSVVCQVAIHISVLVAALNWAKSEMGPEALTQLYDFERNRDKKLASLMNDPAASAEGADGIASWFTGGQNMWSMFKSVPYQPNLLNTVMFLVKTSQQVAVLVVNYKGSPWMQGALENKALFLSMLACACGITVCASGYVPIVNSWLELMVLPPVFRSKLLILLLASTVGTLLVDRLVVLIFAPKIFVASTLNPLKATRFADFVPILKTCGYTAAGLIVAPIALGNPLGMIAAFFAFKRYRQWKQEKEIEELKRLAPELVSLVTPQPAVGAVAQ